MAGELQGVMIDYTNWRGERRVRHVLPYDLAFTASEWHPHPQWILKALDMERGDGILRDFAMSSIHAWTPCTDEMLASANKEGGTTTGDKMDLYDSDTRETLLVEKAAHISNPGEPPILLVYTRAKRGRICQIQRGSVRIHYFIDEPESRKMIAEDARRNGVSLSTIVKNAPPKRRPASPAPDKEGR